MDMTGRVMSRGKKIYDWAVARGESMPSRKSFALTTVVLEIEIGCW